MLNNNNENESLLPKCDKKDPSTNTKEVTFARHADCLDITTFSALPNEVKLHIAKELDTKSKLAVAGTNRSNHALLFHENGLAPTKKKMSLNSYLKIKQELAENEWTAKESTPDLGNENFGSPTCFGASCSCGLGCSSGALIGSIAGAVNMVETSGALSSFFIPFSISTLGCCFFTTAVYGCGVLIEKCDISRHEEANQKIDSLKKDLAPITMNRPSCLKN